MKASGKPIYNSSEPQITPSSSTGNSSPSLPKVSLFANQKTIWLVYGPLLIACIAILMLVDKGSIHLAINRLNSPFADVIFRWITEFGAFPLIAVTIVVTLFFRYRIAMVATVATTLASLLTQVGKRVIWPDSPRPKVFFADTDLLYVVDGVHLHSAHSFPSGHTAGAFALFMTLAFLASKPVYKLLFLLAACLIGYSRMYLSQHFLIDVTVGSVIGTGSALLIYAWFSSGKIGAFKPFDGRIKLARSTKH
jgi:membrane-associated phospholipid phosphatase